MSVQNINKPLIAIVGRPNVGKSTLFNRLIGKRKALVKDEPGVTRDLHYDESEWEGYSFRLLDTGGLDFEAKDSIEEKMSDQALSGIKMADVIMVMMDARAGLTPLDREWAQRLRKMKKPMLYLINKVDSQKIEDHCAEFYELGVENLVPLSAETGRGVGDMLDALIDQIKLLPQPDEIEFEDPENQDDLFKIALIGRPNAGKSTLLNRLMGETRSIVDATPGTTRDPVNSYLKVFGQNYCLIDTAGIRRRGRISKAVEKFSVIKSLQSIEDAHCVFLLLDSTEGITDQDTNIVSEAQKRGKAILFLINKWDEGRHQFGKDAFDQIIERKLHFGLYYPFLYISAKTGAGVKNIFKTLQRVRTQYSYRVPTGVLNREFERIIENHPLPIYQGKNIKIYYATQVGTQPTTFMVFANFPTKIHFSYERYLINALRNAFGLHEVPIRIIFRRKK